MASFEEAPAGDAKAGEKIFRTKCAQCHTVDKGAGHKQGCFIHVILEVCVVRACLGKLIETTYWLLEKVRIL
ncbi:putative cytochrome c, class IA/ IB, cytochrome c-like domain superfamily [Helianthus annuus]|nr:putative cytochrome c, class IA/ IB, cytochrome c-like domain superfamily [Helianthus annuus]